MRAFLDGETLLAAEKMPHTGIKDLAENFVLYGALAEIFARKAGFNRGLGGSMHLFSPPSAPCPTTPSWAGPRTSP